MKKISLLTYIVLFLLGIRLNAQIDCEIHSIQLGLIEEVPEIVCYEEELEFVAGNSLNANPKYLYKWSNGSTSNRTKYTIVENETLVEVDIYELNTSGDTIDHCSDAVTVKMYERFDVTFTQIKWTCSSSKSGNQDNAWVRVEASSPIYSNFTYEWDEGIWSDPDDPQTAIGLGAYKECGVTITNEIGCSQHEVFYPQGYGMPDIEITTDPSDSLFIGNPEASFSFENLSDSIEVTNFFWRFMNDPNSQTFDEETSSEDNPTYQYRCSSTNPYIVNLVVTNQYGCDTTFTHPVRVLPVQLKIPNVITPNGDGFNDTFVITLDEGTARGANPSGEYRPLNDYFESSKVTIFNRWGNVIYTSSDYKNDWDGEKMKDGNYFYVIECSGYRDEVEAGCDCSHTTYRYQGSITIFGSGR